MMMHSWRLVVAVVVLVAAAGLGLWQWQTPGGLFAPTDTDARVIVSGNIEAHESVLSFTQVQGPIVELPFDEGAKVARGTVLARIDARIYQRQVDIDGANQRVAEAQVAVSEQNLLAAQSNVESDQFDLTQKQADLARAEDLVKTSAISVQSRDLARTAAQQSASSLTRDKAMVQVSDANVALARANVTAAAAKLALDEVTLDFSTLRAPFDGVIAVRQAEVGQLAGPGVAIVTLDDLDHVWLRAYVNEPDLGKVRLGQAIDVTTDTFPGKVYHGHIGFISPQAEFTPKTVETHAERVTLVYRVRIDLDNPTHELLPGMPADGTFVPLPAGP
jgi:HlyD family secretion protein